MNDGILLIDKPSGMSSFGVVARNRRVLSDEVGKKIKVGHTGTLDPFATGLMILVVGKECKNASSYSKLDKVYESTITLGKSSSTGDPEGEITDVSNEIPSREAVEDVMARFVGEIRQKPPIFSAIKINGVRAYDLARKGKEVDIPERTVHIYSIEILEYTYPTVCIRVHVSSGTYIRSLASDIGTMLGTGACCTELRRVKVADYDIKDAKQLEYFGIIN